MAYQDDPFLTFSSNFMNRMIQAQQLQLQRETAERQEKRFEEQMRLSQAREERAAGYQAAQLGLGFAREQRQTAHQAEMVRQGQRRLELTEAGQVATAETPSRQVGAYMRGLQPGSPEWMKAAKLVGPQTTVSIDTGIEKSTKAKFESQIDEIDTTLTNLGTLDLLTKPEYLEHMGKGRAYIEKNIEQLGIKKGSQWLSDYSTWDKLAMGALLEERHKITGVAANPVEMVQIARTTPDPDRDSYTSMKAKLAITQDLLRQHRARILKYAQEGVLNPTKEQLAAIPLQLSDKDQQTLEKIDAGQPVTEADLKHTPDDITLDDLDKMSVEELDALEQQMFGGKNVFPEANTPVYPGYEDAFGWTKGMKRAK